MRRRVRADGSKSWIPDLVLEWSNRPLGHNELHSIG
jgi:hypothetical protein